MRTGTAPVAHSVCVLNRRKHAPAVLALDQSAARDPRRVYGVSDGRPFFLKELCDALDAGAGLVVYEVPSGAVVGFCLLRLTKTAVDVVRFVCPDPAAERRLLQALDLTRDNAARAEVILPVIVDLGPPL